MNILLAWQCFVLIFQHEKRLKISREEEKTNKQTREWQHLNLNAINFSIMCYILTESSAKFKLTFFVVVGRIFVANDAGRNSCRILITASITHYIHMFWRCATRTQWRTHTWNSMEFVVWDIRINFGDAFDLFHVSHHPKLS